MIYNIPPKSKVHRTLPLIFRTILVVAYKASTTVFLNACGPKVGLVNTTNIGQFQVVMKALSGYLRSRRSGCKLLIPDLQNQDQRPKTTARPQETRADEFIESEKYLTSHNNVPVVLIPARHNT